MITTKPISYFFAVWSAKLISLLTIAALLFSQKASAEIHSSVPTVGIDYWYGDSWMHGTQLSPHTENYVLKYETLFGRPYVSYAVGGMTLQGAWGSYTSIFANISNNDLPTYSSGDRVFFGFGLNDLIRGKLAGVNIASIASTFQAALSNEIDRLYAKGFPYSSIVIVINYGVNNSEYSYSRSEWLQLRQAMINVANAKGCLKLDWDLFWASRNDIVWKSNDNIHPDEGSNTIMAGNVSVTGVLTALPVKFLNLDIDKKGCHVDINWDVENQLNLKKFEIELSKDNVTFSRIGETTARNATAYTYSFGLTGQTQASTIYLRIKAIDLDGSFSYSKIISAPGTCGNKWQLVLFPNPVSNQSLVTVMAKEGIFDGRYKVSIINNNGQLVQQKELHLNGSRSFPVSVVGLSNGKYYLKIASLLDDTKTMVLTFEKL
jgi:hypothetical protein